MGMKKTSTAILCAGLALGLLSLAAQPCSAHEPDVLRGSPVRVLLEGRREMGIGLRASTAGWRLAIPAKRNINELVFVDVTSTVHDKWVVPVNGEGPTIGGPRFVGGHAYLVQVMRGRDAIETRLVYLYPQRVPHSTSIDFSAAAPTLADDDDDAGIEIAPKSGL
jgi:hypothetical protein